MGFTHHADLFGTPSWRRAALLLLSFLGALPASAQHEHSSSEFEVFVAAEELAVMLSRIHARMTRGSMPT